MSLRRWASHGPSAVWEFRYERKDGTGHFRTITVPVGHGRFRRGEEKAAREIADRRLNEQFGYQPRPDVDEDGNEVTVFDVLPQHRGQERPDLLQENYELVSVTRAL